MPSMVPMMSPILRLLLFGTIVYIGLPIQADQSVFWTSGYTVMAQLESAYTTVAGAANKIAGCLDPALEMWNRVAAVLQAVLMVLTDWAWNYWTFARHARVVAQAEAAPRP